ncbi:MAG: HU family DNA-binding protein [Pseudomonadota bacterium]
MKKSELIMLLSRKNENYSLEDVEKSVAVMIAAMTESLMAGGRAEFRGLGSFFCRQRHAQVMRNPRTGEKVNVTARAYPSFRTSPALLKKLNK